MILFTEPASESGKVECPLLLPPFPSSFQSQREGDCQLAPETPPRPGGRIIGQGHPQLGAATLRAQSSLCPRRSSCPLRAFRAHDTVACRADKNRALALHIVNRFLEGRHRFLEGRDWATHRPGRPRERRPAELALDDCRHRLAPPPVFPVAKSQLGCRRCGRSGILPLAS